MTDFLDSSTAFLKLVPSGVEVFTARTDYLDSGTARLSLTPLRQLEVGPNPQRATFISGPGEGIVAGYGPQSYIDIPVTPPPTPLYIEFDLSWTIDQWDGWVPYARSPAFIYCAGVGVGGSYEMYIYTNSKQLQDTLSGLNLTVLDRQSMHIQVTFIGGTVTVYIDGVQRSTSTSYGLYGIPITHVQLGAPQLNGSNTTITLDNIKVGTTSGGTDYAGINFNDGTFGGFSLVGQAVIDAYPPPNIDARTAKLNFTPSKAVFETPPTRRALCIGYEPSQLEYVFPTPVGSSDELYLSCELSWLYGHSWVWGNTAFIELLDASDNVVSGIELTADDKDWRWGTYRWSGESYFFTDNQTRWPGPGRELIKAHISGSKNTWSVRGVSGLPEDLTGLNPITKIRFGLDAGGSSYDGGSCAGLFVDDVKIGHTPAYELVNEDFEDGTPGVLTEIGTILYPDDGDSKTSAFHVQAHGTNYGTRDQRIWYGPLNTSQTVYVEYDVSWTATQEALFGSYTGAFNFFWDGRDNDNWQSGLYHDSTSWQDEDNTWAGYSDVLDGTGASHHVKVVFDQNGHYHYYIDGVDAGVSTDTSHTGDQLKADSIAFGWVTGGDNESGATFSHIKIGYTDGGSEIYDQTTDSRDPYNVFAIGDGVTRSTTSVSGDITDVGAARVKFSIWTADSGVIKLNFLPETLEEALCHFRIDISGVAYKRWDAFAYKRFFGVEESRRWEALVTELPIPDPC